MLHWFGALWLATKYFPVNQSARNTAIFGGKISLNHCAMKGFEKYQFHDAVMLQRLFCNQFLKFIWRFRSFSFQKVPVSIPQKIWIIYKLQILLWLDAALRQQKLKITFNIWLSRDLCSNAFYLPFTYNIRKGSFTRRAFDACRCGRQVRFCKIRNFSICPATHTSAEPARVKRTLCEWALRCVHKFSFLTWPFSASFPLPIWKM